jgi:hypothetical protein
VTGKDEGRSLTTRPRAAGTLRRVSAEPPHPVVVTLELDPSSDPIRGIARDEHGAERPFTGWLGLARALEAALEAEPRIRS